MTEHEFGPELRRLTEEIQPPPRLARWNGPAVLPKHAPRSRWAWALALALVAGGGAVGLGAVENHPIFAPGQSSPRSEATISPQISGLSAPATTPSPGATATAASPAASPTSSAAGNPLPVGNPTPKATPSPSPSASSGCTPSYTYRHSFSVIDTGKNDDPSAAALGPDGNIWFADATGNNNSYGVLRYTPSSGQFSVFPASFTGGSSQYNGIAVGPDGNIWATQQTPNSVVRLNTSGTLLQKYSAPQSGGEPAGIISGPDGNVWYTERQAGYLVRINVNTGAQTAFNMASSGDSFPEPKSIAIGPDNNLWITERTGNNVDRFDMSTHTFTRFPLPSANAQPHGIVWDNARGVFWIAEYNIGKIVSMTTAGSFKEYGVLAANPRDLIVAADCQVWFALDNYGGVGSLNPTTGAVSNYQASGSSSSTPVAGITVGKDNCLYLGEEWGGAIIRFC